MRKYYAALAVALLMLVCLLPPAPARANIATKVATELMESAERSFLKKAGYEFKVVNTPETGTESAYKALYETEGAASKGVLSRMADVASGTFDEFDAMVQGASPVPGRPGWLKVTMGVVLIGTSLDIISDVYTIYTNTHKITYTVDPLTYPVVLKSRTKMLGWSYEVRSTPGYVNPQNGLAVDYVLSTVSPAGQVANSYYVYTANNQGRPPVSDYWQIAKQWWSGTLDDGRHWEGNVYGWVAKFDLATFSTYVSTGAVYFPSEDGTFPAVEVEYAPLPEVDWIAPLTMPQIVPMTIEFPNPQEVPDWEQQLDELPSGSPSSPSAPEEPGTGTDTGTGADPVPDDGTQLGYPPYDSYPDVQDPPVPDVEPVPIPKPESVSIDLEPLKKSFRDISLRFPFSIPWDVARLLSVFDVAPEAPVWHIGIHKRFKFGSKVVPWDMGFDIDLSHFDTMAKITRWFLIIAFDLGVALKVRSFIPS